MLKRHPLSEQGKLVAGVDEVGRGSVAGPVVAACVILNPGFSSPLLKDSKKLSENKRIEASKLIMENSIFFRIAQIEAPRIDEINILNATMEAMNKCVIGHSIDLLLVDGNQWRNQSNGIPYELVIKGDNTYQEIAAASIIAKTYRDTLMRELSLEYPNYGWESNAGYFSAGHIESVIKNGITPQHRKSFLKRYII
jgi:ribonuclease HII